MSYASNLKGKKFGKLKVIKISSQKRKNTGRIWECKCECGEICHVSSGDLNRGRVNFCKPCVELKAIESIYKRLLYVYKRGATIRNKKFKLKDEEFYKLIEQNCYFCGIEPRQLFTKKGWKYSLYYNGIDRLNNKKDYTKENCVPCCKFCNISKNRYDAEEYQEWINHIRNYKP